MILPTLIQNLKEAAGKATPGPWSISQFLPLDSAQVRCAAPDSGFLSRVVATTRDGGARAVVADKMPRCECVDGHGTARAALESIGEVLKAAHGCADGCDFRSNQVQHE